MHPIRVADVFPLVERALVFQKCVSGSIPGLNVVSCLSLLSFLFCPESSLPRRDLLGVNTRSSLTNVC